MQRSRNSLPLHHFKLIVRMLAIEQRCGDRCAESAFAQVEFGRLSGCSGSSVRSALLPRYRSDYRRLGRPVE